MCIRDRFQAVFLIWRWSAFRGDFALLPAIHLITGLGLVLAVSLRDPLRDTLEFSKFAWGVALGCAVLLLPLLRILNYQRFKNWCYTPLFGALGLFVLLLRFGSGPGEMCIRDRTTRVAFLIYGFVLGVVLALALRWPKP